MKAYENDADVKITLLEGSVSENANTKRQMLKPGEQAIIKTGNIELVEHADTEQAMAWKNGYTSFHSADIETVLKELERWYDITTEIKGQVRIKSFYLEAPRSAPLKDVLKSILEDNNMNYEYKEITRKLTVLP